MRPIINYLTIDVEDYFQVSAFENIIGSYENWGKYSARVTENTENILDTLDAHRTKATFFVLGWIAEKFPELVKLIAHRGHHIGCHSYHHRLVYELTPDQFFKDSQKAKDLIEQTIGMPVVGYRAPSYSITTESLWAFGILEELGFTFDSSVFPIRHDRYGIPGAPRFEYKVPKHNLIEYPISTSRLLGSNIPISGGGYFRLFPYWLTRILLKKINEQEKKPFVFYLHPWEIDPSQPRINNASPLSKFRHYNNLGKTASRFERLLNDFRFGPLKGIA